VFRREKLDLPRTAAWEENAGREMVWRDSKKDGAEFKRNIQGGKVKGDGQQLQNGERGTNLGRA